MAIHYHKRNISVNQNRSLERSLLVVLSVLFLSLFFKLYVGYQKKFIETEKGYANGTILNIDKGFQRDKLVNLLKNGSYIEDDAVDPVVNLLYEKLQQGAPLENLGELNKKRFAVRVGYLDSIGSLYLTSRAERAYRSISMNDTIQQIHKNAELKYSVVHVGNGKRKITLRVIEDNNTEGWLGRFVYKMKKVANAHYGTPVPLVLVALQQYAYKNGSDSAYIVDRKYAMTDHEGKVTFDNLEDNGSYSVLPIKRGFEYGSPKGTNNKYGKMLNDLDNLVFIQKTHTVKLLATDVYKQLKEDDALTVRTPSNFLSNFTFWCISFLLAYWAIHISWSFGSHAYDQLILPLLMLLTGLCVLIMYAIHDPLKDNLRGMEMARGTIGGLVALTIIVRVNIVKYYNSRLFDFQGLLKNKRYNQPGYLYIMGALVLVLSLFPFGTGPEGSDAKVNLFFFQPSEITKYLVVIFFAAFFSKNAIYFTDLPDARKRFKKAIWTVSGLGALMFFYLGLGDMGPALVLCGLFIVFYSVARGDFPQLCLGAILYVTCLWAIKQWAEGSTTLLIIVTIFWCAGWALFGWMYKKTFFPSAFYLTMVIATFIFGQYLPKVGDRLVNRNQMFSSIWDNNTCGGDQVAHGIWSISTGGFTGQGIGNGNSNAMPAAHTDMILASIGEELGLLGLVVVFASIALLLYHSLVIARRSGHSFAFYLAAGIAVITAIQFLIISAGCFGLLPLTGITVPFLSYGKASMVINIAAFGIVLAVSKLSGNKMQDEYIRKRFDNTLVAGILSYSVAAIGIVLVLANYMIFNANTYIIKPAIVIDKTGTRIVSYNPRISLLLKKIQPGDIYDRNHLLLATSSKAKFADAARSSIAAGVPDSVINIQIGRRLKRYYPFSNYLFFWLNDYNNPLEWGSNDYGFFAENRYYSLLRGLKETESTKFDDTSNIYKAVAFLPRTTHVAELAFKNYSQLIPYLKAGINSHNVEEFNNIKKDITLTVDAKLQTKLENGITKFLDDVQNEGSYAKAKNWRTSIVVLDPTTGDVLSSAVYPLPDNGVMRKLIADDSEQYNINRISFPSSYGSNYSVFTERDLGTTFATAPGSTAKVISGLAGLNKLGVAGADMTYSVKDYERVRTSDPSGNINMSKAIELSSNPYFIKLINDQHLDEFLSNIYLAIGIGVGNKKGYANYYLFENENATIEKQRKAKEQWQHIYDERRTNFIKSYNDLDTNEWKKLKNSEFSGLAWGQGKMTATPLVMARLTGAVVSNGQLNNSKFILKSDIPIDTKQLPPVQITTQENAAIMEGFMFIQSSTSTLRETTMQIKNRLIGKTGTPERFVYTHDQTELKKVNDGWYMFAIPGNAGTPIVACIRLERLPEGELGSKVAVDVAKTVVLPSLESLNYIHLQKK